MAIEAYLNLMDVCFIGEEFLEKRERKPLHQKLNSVFHAINHDVPEDIRGKIVSLFNQRNELTHQKPRGHILETVAYDNKHPITSFADINAVFDEINLPVENIDEYMGLYGELQDCVKRLRGAKYELSEEIQLGLQDE